MNLSLLCPILVFAVGTYLLFKLKFFFILHPRRTLKAFAGSLKAPESRRALFLALAGTLGVGNIFGVAAGIIYGGAGSVFWLAVSSVFSAVLKYAECALCFDSLSADGGGMHLSLKRAFPQLGYSLSVIYAVACTLVALTMGGAMQITAVIDTFSALTNKNVLLPTIMFTIMIFLGVVGGGDKIEKITEKIIPLTMIVYILLSFGPILLNFSTVGNVALKIIRDALNPKSAVVGVGLSHYIKQFSEGFARGILSNEAGCGTSSFAHSRSPDRTPYHAGLSGICEVFFDTSVLCVLTAFAILCAVDNPEEYASPMSLVSVAVGNTLGEISQVLLLFCIAAFAYSTVICWFYYGKVTSSFLFPKHGAKIFCLLFFASLIFGCYVPSRTLIEMTDSLLLVLSALTLMALLHSAERIKMLTDQ